MIYLIGIMRNDSIIKIKNLSYMYEKDKKALDDINLEINKGSFHGLIGANGAGKSTLLKILIKALNIQSGEIYYKDYSINDKKNNNVIISYIPDESIFPAGLNVYEYIKNEVSVNRKISNIDLKKELNKWFEHFNLIDVIKKSPNNLSSGQKKKIELIRVILEEPEIIILDEPANFLDPQSRLFMFECLKWLTEKGVTIIISSHVIHELNQYVDSATILDCGQIKFSGQTIEQDILAIYNQINSEKIKVFKNE